MSNAVTARLGTRDRQAPAPRLFSHCHIVTLPHCQSHRRRGSALMVALALLMMLAVFASLFLTSSRFDVDASAADLDTVRMDLYAEGLAQYIQSCMVADLWGFDQIPLNYDGFVPRPGAVPAGMPVDNPFDYFGGRFVLNTGTDVTLDATEVASFGTGATDLVNRDTAYYPDFWLTSPNTIAQNKFGTAIADVAWERPAFAPFGVTRVMRDNISTPAIPRMFTYNSDSNLVATRFGNKAFTAGNDTPWLFWKALGNGLYIRAAVRVEDTSSRINLNVARNPISVAGVNYYPDLYQGYPTDVYKALPVFGDETLGRFLSEMNLSAVTGAAPATALNAGLYVAANDVTPGRYGTPAAAPPPVSWPDALADALAPPGTITPELANLLGDADNTSFTYTVPGRVSNSLANDITPGSIWNLGAPVTFDPDGLARRLAAPKGNAASPGEQDRPFGADEMFDLMSPLTYTSMAGLPSVTRLERLWAGFPFFADLTNSQTIRPLLTTYSWTANLCPYGVDPYADQTYRKLDLNTSTAAELVAALDGAFTKAVYDGSGLAGATRITWIDQFVANAIDFRTNKSLTVPELDRYLMHLSRSGTTTTVQAPWQFEWDPAIWTAYMAALPPPYTNNEPAYLGYLASLRTSNLGAYNAELIAISATNVSAVKPVTLTPTAGGWTGKVYGFTRSPFITEVWCSIADGNDVSAIANNYAVELYNPWPTDLNLTGWHVRVRNVPNLASPAIVVDLTGNVLPAGARLVISRAVIGAMTPPSFAIVNPNLVIAKQLPVDQNPIVELVYFPGSATDLADAGVEADFAVFDNTPATLLADFQGGGPTPVSFDRSRRDDSNSGFWCYQYWEAKLPTLIADAANGAALDLTNPWTVGTFGPNPAVPVTDAGQFLSPADLVLVPYGVPQQVHRTGGVETTTGATFADATLATDPTSELTRFQTLGFTRPKLFHRKYNTLDGAGDNNGSNYTADAAPQFEFVFQALMDFVTVADFSADGVDNDGNGTIDGAAGKPDSAELRIPGRLNVNTVTEWQTLNACQNLLPTFGAFAAGSPDANFWDRLLNYRDKRNPGGPAGDWYSRAPNTRRNSLASLVIPVRDTTVAAEDQASFLGFEQLGELCNLQYQGDWTFRGFWQNAVAMPRLPQQYNRRFAQNANLLSVRSDTYMVTLRVEIVRPVFDNAGVFQRIDSFGQREHMYLVDRSYCAKAPQLAPIAGDPAFSGKVNPDYIPPRAWRMSIPRYPAYGG